MEKEDYYISVFMGTDYQIENPKTIGELKNKLEEIIGDLPEDKTLKISEFHVLSGKIGYILEDGIPQ